MGNFAYCFVWEIWGNLVWQRLTWGYRLICFQYSTSSTTKLSNPRVIHVMMNSWSIQKVFNTKHRTKKTTKNNFEMLFWVVSVSLKNFWEKSKNKRFSVLQMIKRCVTYEGELLPFHQFDMDVGFVRLLRTLANNVFCRYDQGLDRVFVIWPITICHEIDERSPLWDIGADDLKSAKFEIIGTV